MRERCVAVVVALGLTAFSAISSGQPSFTLEQILSAPFPSGLVSAPEHGLLAWTENVEGRRNVFVAESPGYSPRRITSYAEDDGQEIGQLAIDAAEKRLVFVRGDAPNRAGEFPNPTSDPEGAERAIYVVPVDGNAAPRKLAAGTGPAIAPDGRLVAFVKQGQIWTVPLDGEGEAKALATTRGSAGSLRFSPDGSRLAFTSDRGDHGFIGVFTFADRSLRYLDPSVAMDHDPVWSQDGSRIAYLREPHEKRVLPFLPRRSALPWSIRVTDAASGEGSEVFVADPGPGSAFRGIVADHQILWAGDRLVFPWEKDGWTHLYSVPASGGAAPLLLTPGTSEVEHVSLSADGREILFSSNQDDVDRRHLWRVAVSGGTPTPITSGSGIEWSPVPADPEGAVAFIASTARRPGQVTVASPAEAPRAVDPKAIPAGFPAEALVEPEPVIFGAADGMPIHGQIFRPRSRPGERHPAVIFFHGGSRRQMLLGWHYMYYYRNAYAMNQYLASRGYLVLSVNYRSGIGYGMEFREALDYGARGASEYRDVVGAGLYLRSRDDVDPDRIGLWGGSYGGYLTALGLARASDLFAAGVDLHGVHDWNVVIQNFVPSYDAEERDDVAELAFESSPMASVDRWRSPVLLIHGDDDRNVPFSESVDLAESLAKRGVDFEQLVFPDEVHDFLLHRHWLAAYEAASAFFDRRLTRSSIVSEP